MRNFSLPIRFGLATSGSLIAYFLILSLINLHTQVFYSLFNVVITGFGIYEAIKYRVLEEGQKFNYAKGFSTGLITGFMGTLIFTLFFAFYATEINTDFLTQLFENRFENLNLEGMVFFTVAIMGIATTLILTLTFMQLFKTSKNLNKKQ
ncbi:DUF4199 domain-containing protein [Maribacter hydrothermalis]|uniref:DUF4199 domain-containing protein n=1 Tax=Maribacter hydrothermalis TaxID=1836467 RepID=A0A1B7ZCH6_9FLAO|nr:DUF4199 domain-containing protein [Maribacter hydrothermalis]APQ18607.1 DUF4199 domain-containing protein [Maribacter hydrothermalis]OBR40837.1 hypothetical protein A9200_14705 [Maribacter hydrothermalis]